MSLRRVVLQLLVDREWQSGNGRLILRPYYLCRAIVKRFKLTEESRWGTDADVVIDQDVTPVSLLNPLEVCCHLEIIHNPPGKSRWLRLSRQMRARLSSHVVLLHRYPQAPFGSALARLTQLLMRLDHLSHIAIWTKSEADEGVAVHAALVLWGSRPPVTSSHFLPA